ncbi:hypothetical protein EV356DRAFT_482261 [Viridothelium virens]|uniref:DUF6594 domain-containing protein n=1 Tax=Viridothelium virens TaxID=1048519 RepID=A0A6A6HF56_VIRVR|nr:hypothetical protein EV356DRAFT_482261 [Viridothelium virens]
MEQMEKLDAMEKGTLYEGRWPNWRSLREHIFSLLRGGPRLPETALPWGHREIERYRPGYPLYASLLGRQPEFQMFRKFRRVRMRLILLKQDRIVQLEGKLDELDALEETIPSLESSRLDCNLERKDVLEQLDRAVSDYDNFLCRSQFSLHQAQPSARHRERLQGWVEKNAAIACTETGYLSPDDYCDLMGLGPLAERDMPSFYPAVEKLLYLLRIASAKMSRRNHNETIEASSLPKGNIRAVTRALTASFAIVLLLVPVIVLNAVSTTVHRFVIIFVSATLFVSLLTLASKARITEVFAAGATYAAVLVVFVSGNGVAKQ